MTDSPDFQKAALAYHADPVPGKLHVSPSKPVRNQQDLALCYSPGVAAPVRAIARDANEAWRYTIRGNLVGVISNGTAVLGLGAVGALASKPVMEGKAVLFKHFAGIDAFDIEIDCDDPVALIETIVRIAPTFGAINLEDIRAPECFEIEKALIAKLKIPVMHDDQHGTAIVVAAGLLNALVLQGKSPAEAKLVCVGAGAAGIATLHLLADLGIPRENMLLVDTKGVIHAGRTDLNPYKQPFAVQTDCRTLAEAMKSADVFVGVSGPGIVTSDMLKVMSHKPVVFALSNPDPEVLPETVRAVRPDAVVATGRSDYPNQVNNALCFPYLFRGALDVQASCINRPMMMAAVHALQALAQEPLSPAAASACGWPEPPVFGPAFILPGLLDPRLRERVSSAVALAAVQSGVAGKPFCPAG